MSKLHLAENLSLPLDACTQTFAWIGRKGSGKTYGSGKLVEELLRASVQTVILDTVGNWYGLRIAADGKGKGFDVPVFGGLRQDLPLLSTAGEVVADVVMDSRRSVILDVSQFNFSERKRFAADFGTRLWQRKKGEAEPSPLHLVIEECQLIVPQFVQKDETRMVHVYEEIIRLGRNYGIGVSMLTQRPQSVNKEVLTQAECIMAFQINGVPERKALKEWLTYEGGDVNLVNELPGLPVGTCYLWSPQWLRKFQKITIGKKLTLDASATPKAGKQMIRRDPAPLDVKDIEARMTSTIEKAKADDPKELHRQIVSLQRELNLHKQVTPAQSVATIKEVPVLKEGQLKRVESVITQAQAIMEKLGPLLNGLRDAVAKTGNNIPEKRTTISHVPHKIEIVSARRPIVSRIDPVVSGSGVQTDGQLGTGELKILTAVAQYPNGATREQLTVLTGYKRSSRDTYLQRLLSKRYVDHFSNGILVASTKGLDALGNDFEPLPTGDALQSHWRDRLPTGERRILHQLIVAYPQAVERDVITEQTGYKRSSRDTYLQRLSARQLIITIDRGAVRASDLLFD